jgi:hypothetical protein
MNSHSSSRRYRETNHGSQQHVACQGKCKQPGATAADAPACACRVSRQWPEHGDRAQLAERHVYC